MAKKIEIAGELVSTATGNKVADVANIKDKTQGDKSQAQINAEHETALVDRYTKAETYNKTELNNMVTTPNQQYVSVIATVQTTSVTDVLPSTGAANTIYRVGNWDDSQFDDSVYSEYAWNGSQYVHLSTKTNIGEVFDISAYHATSGTLAIYDNLAAALDSENGGGVPFSLRKGGMTVKFVHTSDNKYVQARCMAQNFTTDVTQWQAVDDEPTAGSRNLVESGGVFEELHKENLDNILLENSISGYIASDGSIGTNTSLKAMYVSCAAEDKYKLRFERFSATSARCWAIYSTDNIAEVSSSNLLAIGPVGEAGVDYEIKVENSEAKLLLIQNNISATRPYSPTLIKLRYSNKFEDLATDVETNMIASRDWTISGNVVYDSNEIPQSYNILWSDGTTGTVVMSNFDSDVFEYTTITATYSTKTVVYSLTFDINGYLINETYNIQ